MIIEEEVYLEHFGVKGMHWGKRKARKPFTTAQKRVKTAHRVFLGVRLAAGALFVASLFSSGNTNVKLPRTGPITDAHGIRDHFPIHPNARSTFLYQERQRNGAFQIKKMLKKMGEDVI